MGYVGPNKAYAAANLRFYLMYESSCWWQKGGGGGTRMSENIQKKNVSGSEKQIRGHLLVARYHMDQTANRHLCKQL